MKEPVCPQCGKDFVQRTHRDGLLERLLSVAYVYPFRCQLCMHRFRTMQWGKQYVKEAIDKRQFQRIPIRFPVSFTCEQTQGTGTVTDISMAGCGLETEARPVTGGLLQLELRISDQEPAVKVEAATVRSVRLKFVGVQFLRLSAEDKERLSRFMRNLLAATRRV